MRPLRNIFYKLSRTEQRREGVAAYLWGEEREEGGGEYEIITKTSNEAKKEYHAFLLSFDLHNTHNPWLRV